MYPFFKGSADPTTDVPEPLTYKGISFLLHSLISLIISSLFLGKKIFSGNFTFCFAVEES